MSSHNEGPEEGVDPLTFYREKCSEESHIQKLKEILEECNSRVESRSNTLETCQQEMCDYVAALDHCAQPKAFARLK